MFNVQNIKPRNELKRYIRKISVFESNEVLNFKHKLTPSAFTYLSYNHKHIPICYYGEKKVHPKDRLQIAGPKTNDNIHVLYNNSISQILVEFKATGFYSLFHKSPINHTNCLTDLKKIISPTFCSQLESRLLMQNKINKQVEIIEEFLIDKSYKAIPILDYLEKGVRLIERNHGNISVNKIVKEIGIGRRQFDRKFQEVVGVTPKYYAKIMRLFFVIGLMSAKKYSSIQDLAYNADFYDFPHFVHRFKELTGFTPNEFINSERHIAMKYFNDIFK